ncbi:MAG: hypothetical protein II163_01040 [Ruminococcus sp.]|nr:hypothetical protein [Ruminococcus sp.]
MAAKKTKGKTSSKKSTNSARSRSSASRTSQRGAKAQPKRRLNPQIKAIILCAVGILLLALVIIPGGALWKPCARSCSACSACARSWCRWCSSTSV